MGHPSQASVSIGLVSHPEDGLSSEELMAAADRAMYQAKSLGKNQISGNPRPRPALLARRSTLEPAPSPTVAPRPVAPPEARAAAEEPPAPAPEEPPATASERSRAVASAAADGMVALPLGPVVPNERPPHGEIEDDEADPLEVRRRIAAASRSFDPDDQVRRAMDAFFSPTLPKVEAERTGQPEH
jgi:hypothetical protein